MSIYEHFRHDEKEWIDQVLEWRSYVEDTYAPKKTDFLDPRQQAILQSIIGKNGEVEVTFFGGQSHTERRRAILSPDYMTPSSDDYDIALWNIDYPQKFVNLEHREILGSLMGLGLKREKFGDILMETSKGIIQFYACKEVSDYLSLNFQQVGRNKIKLEELPLEQAIVKAEDGSEKQITSSSLRLDAVISQVVPFSRQKVQQWIQQGNVKVNWKLVEQTSFECKVGDTLSIRGFGRITIKTIEGQTKKGKTRLTVILQKS